MLDALAEPTPTQHGTWALVIRSHGQTLATDQAYLGADVSYQQALWTGAIQALHRIEAESRGVPVDLCTDDHALAQTLLGHPAPSYAPKALVREARELLSRLPSVSVRWIHGTHNKPADDLSVTTWAEALGKSVEGARAEIDAIREQRRAEKKQRRSSVAG
ncbi:MAG TPA: reverse transcriptase-like protein [Blastocatellia bacterium]|nr:reverse transcriptase-like protein [Blastocatellia bacterium]